MKTDNREEAVNLIVSQARRLGFICQVSEEGKWTISSTENWRLSETENQWLLSVKTIPQVYLCDAKALEFLKRQWQRKFNRPDEKHIPFPSARRGF
jgi:hypothetical protein